jgi:hypothetical protein
MLEERDFTATGMTRSSAIAISEASPHHSVAFSTMPDARRASAPHEASPSAERGMNNSIVVVFIVFILIDILFLV